MQPLLSCWQWAAGCPGESCPHCFCLNQRIHRRRTVGQSYLDSCPSGSTSSHPRGTSHSCTGNSNCVLQPAGWYLGCLSTTLTQRKILLTKPTQPSHACDHRECAALAPCLLPATALLASAEATLGEIQEQSNHNKGMKGRVQGKNKGCKLKKDNRNEEKQCLEASVQGAQNKFVHRKHLLLEWKS